MGGGLLLACPEGASQEEHPQSMVGILGASPHDSKGLRGDLAAGTASSQGHIYHASWELGVNSWARQGLGTVGHVEVRSPGIGALWKFSVHFHSAFMYF